MCIVQVLNLFAGGGCKLCGSVEHLKANCPEKQKSSGGETGVRVCGGGGGCM